MFSGRSIPDELWAQAHQRLIFYFTRRMGTDNAQDLAQKTLLAVWTRKDYEFAKEEDFFKVCYGFAKRILLEAYREGVQRHGHVELTPDLEEKIFGVRGLKGPEASAFLEEVKHHAQTILTAEEWALIQAAANRDQHSLPITGKIRTKIHRIRKKLAKKTGWGKSEV